MERSFSRKAARPLLLVLGLALMLGCFSGCSGFGSRYANADKYTSGDRDISDEINEIDINWSSGSVTVKRHDQKTVSVRETCNKDISDAKKVHTWVDGKTLRVQFSKSGESFTFTSIDKDLEICIPKDMKLVCLSYDGSSADSRFEEIEADLISVDVSSGNTKLIDVTAKQIEIDTSSGDVEVEQKGETDRLNVDSSSGDIDIKGETINKLHLDSSSGDVKADVDKTDDFYGDSSSGEFKLWFKELPSKADIDTSSGDVKLYLPKDGDFQIEVDTSSGDFESEHSLSKNGDTYTSGSGSSKFYVDTSSGDITVNYYD